MDTRKQQKKTEEKFKTRHDSDSEYSEADSPRSWRLKPKHNSRYLSYIQDKSASAISRLHKDQTQITTWMWLIILAFCRKMSLNRTRIYKLKFSLHWQLLVSTPVCALVTITLNVEHWVSRWGIIIWCCDIHVILAFPEEWCYEE